MRIAAQRLIFGASWFCLLRTTLGSTSPSICIAAQKTMSSMRPSEVVPSKQESSKAESTATYVAGSSSIAYVTTPDETTAKKLARSLVENKLAACVNIIPKITSIYVWEDNVNEDTECMLIIKTRTSRIEELIKYVRDNHPYSVAEVITMAIENGNPPYMEWLERSVANVKVNTKEK